jgi:hypothetical protein
MKTVSVVAAVFIVCVLHVQAVTLTVDAGPARRQPINEHIYGMNIANWCQHYYLELCEPHLTNAGVTVMRYGATNIERYNWRNNRMYNVISKTNQFVPTSWEAFVDWVRNDLNAEPFLQASVFSHVAADYGSPNYNTNQTVNDVMEWVEAAGTNVSIWGVGNEPFIAWKLEGYSGEMGDESYAYNDGAHGDQIYNEDVAADAYFPQFISVASSIRAANEEAVILGPTPANWWLYWSTDYSPFCPATRANPGDHTNNFGWFMMSAAANQWDPHVFPDRAGAPDVIGWEQNPETGEFNDHRVMCQFVKRVGEFAAANSGTQVCDYLDFHRYMNCNQDAVAVQETRDLWDPDYASYDKETGGSGTKTRILDRFQGIIDHYYTNMHMSLSEYDFFYWQGHPDEPQIAALGQVDYLGIFAKYGVQLACNWYIGEPDQSGGGYHHAADSAKQAMFDELGHPNPKYWAFKLMSDNFRDQALFAESSDNDMFSVYAGMDVAESQLVCVAHYKGQYYPWYDEDHAGAFIEGQGSSNATLVVSNFTITGIDSVHRFGRDDPYIVHMDTGGVSVAGNSFTYAFDPLAVYLFRLNGSNTPPAETVPDTYVHVNPSRVDFGPYETGMEVLEEEDHETHAVTVTTNYTHTIKITNNRNSNTTWSLSTTTPWLEILGSGSGTATVTDLAYIRITNKSAYAVGVYSGDVTAVTSEGTTNVPVTMEVLPGADNGELRLFDAETHSLAHAWGAEEPYSLGFYDGHGNTEDRNNPYVYTFSMDYDEVSDVGGLASLHVDFDRTAGDNSAGRLYTAFGTYGHYDHTYCWVPTNANPSNYVFKFDIKTKTEGTGFTKTRLLIVITDEDQQKAKPDVLVNSFKDSMELNDGYWQTISIPLGTNFFDWAYPGGQDGSYVDLDFSRIRQVEFCPWVGREDKKGTMWLDNLRIETVDGSSNRYPVAIARQNKRLIGTTETATLTATNSYDTDGSIASYAWSPATGLSATNVASPTFTPPSAGVYTFGLKVTDNEGLQSRDAAQVVVKVIPTLVGTEMKMYRDAAMTDEIGGVADNALDVYVKLTCSSGGTVDVPDFTMAEVSSTDTYGPDAFNNVDDIEIVLEETADNSRVFTGHFRLAAFSEELEEEIGVSEGVTVAVSNAGVSASATVGEQTYGYLKYVDHVERGVSAYNEFEGTWYTYDDNYNANTSTVTMAATNDGAHAGSSQSVYGYAELELGPTGSVDQLFAGIGAKITPWPDGSSNAICDLSSTTGVEGMSFWLKGNGTRLSVVLRSLAVTNYDDYLYTIENTPSNGWRQYHLLFTDFEQEGWGNEAVEREEVLRRVNSLQFKFASKINHETNEVQIDDLALFGGDVTYASNVIYHKENTISMEGYAGMSLDNPSFTNAGGSTTTISGWTLAGNVRGEDWGANGGDAVFEAWNGTSGSIDQVVTNITAGSDYKFATEMSKHADYDGTVYLEILWLSAADAELQTNTTADIADDLTTASWPLSSHDTGFITAPAGAAKMKVRVKVDSVSAENCKVHDASISPRQQADNGWQMWVDGFSVSYTTNSAEGEKAAVLTSTNTDWVAGMYVPPFSSAGVTMTNFSSWDGLAVKARRADSYTGTGGTDARIRLSIVTGESNEVAKTRWQPVDSSMWEDYLVFDKDRFYTTATADTNDPAGLVVYTNGWNAVDRIYIYYGPGTNGLTPYDVLLDDFRACSGTYLH